MTILEIHSTITHRSLMNKNKYELASEVLRLLDATDDLAKELAKEREKFTMHTAHVHAWLSAVVQELGVAKAGDTIDVATACTKIMDRVKAITFDRREELKRAFVAGCCAVLTWTKSGMPQDDLDEAGYDYAASTIATDGSSKG